jgi:predicted metalloprotease
MFKLFFLFIIMPVLIIFLVGGFTVFKFLFRVKQMSKQFGANGGFQQQQRSQQRSQRRSNAASADETLYDSRSTEDRNKKIFAKEDGEYVDYEEVK